jgi:mannose-6-phosphate isomerase-like protein (cupin superfamily)
MKHVEKTWGEEIWYVNGPLYCCKELILNPGFQCSLHKHEIKTETFLILSGNCKLEFGDKIRFMFPGDEQEIAVGTYHRFSLDKEAKEPCRILEVSTHHEDSDSYRITESGPIE